MRAVVQERYGPPEEVLRVADVPAPRAGRGEVLVRVRAAGVDPGVWHLVTGLPYAVRLGSGLRRPRRPTPGMDLAGVVEAVGPGVGGLAPGDEVFGTGTSTFAELAVAPERTLAAKPAGTSFAQAAAVPVSGQAALGAVRAARVGPGAEVMVIGAGGGVGSFAVQLAVARGARVTAVCSAGKADLVRSLGAEDVVDHAREDITARGRRYDAVLDAAGNRALKHLRTVLAPSGTLVLVGGEGSRGRLLAGFDRQLRAPLLSPFVRGRLVMLVSLSRAQDLRELAALLESGAVAPVLERTRPLAEAADAVRQVGSGHGRGKVVLVP